MRKRTALYSAYPNRRSFAGSTLLLGIYNGLGVVAGLFARYLRTLSDRNQGNVLPQRVEHRRGGPTHIY